MLMSISQFSLSVPSQAKARKTQRSALLTDDGKKLGNFETEDGGLIKFSPDIPLDDNTGEQFGKDYANVGEEGEPTIVVGAKYITPVGSQASNEAAEKLTWEETSRDGALYGKIYSPGQRSKTLSHATVCTTIYKNGIGAVLDGKVFLNYRLPADTKNDLRMRFPELRNSKYWRHEASDAIGRNKKCRQERHAERKVAKKQKTT